jgi:outer membrane protein OmpA-like peptidoglycan-associated protein
MKMRSPKTQMKSRNLPKITAVFTLLSTALTPVANANVVGTSFQNFNPTGNGNDYVTVRSSETVGAGNFSLGLFLNNASNTLPYNEADGEAGKQSRSKINDNLLGTDVSIGYGVLPRLDLGVVIPAVVYQSSKAEDEHGEFTNTGVTEYRLFTKANVLKKEGGGVAVAGSTNINQTNNNPYAGAGAGPAYSLELIGDLYFGALSVAGNLGYRWANSGDGDGETPIQPFGNSLLTSAALGYKFNDKVQGIWEIFGNNAKGSELDYSGRSSTTAESIVGIKYFKTTDLTMQFGGGSELIHGTSTPDWRLYAGLTYVRSMKRQPAAQKAVAEVPPPAPAPAPVAQEPEIIIVVSDVLFDFNSSRVVRKGALKTIEGFMTPLMKKGDLEQIVIEGHTCSVGDAGYNKSLSLKRAEAIRDMIVRRYGMSKDKVSAVGRGEERPVASNDNRISRAKNRRVEFKIFRKENKSPDSLAAKQ